jgi:Cdc6-like AAA superfamily ATPase
MGNDLEELNNCGSELQVQSSSDTSRPIEASTERPHLVDLSTKTDRWAILGSGVFRPTTTATKELPPGVYSAAVDSNGNLLIVSRTIITDDLIELPDSGGEEVLAGIRKFWTRKESFAARKQIFKRGILLYGPPGGGKTSVIMLLIKDLVDGGGVVLYVNEPNLATHALTEIRKIEPERPIICILEDIDELVRRYGEHTLLQLLDGETQVANIVFVATTNYPELLAKRIINRPSRFDLVKKISVPSQIARRIYFQTRLPDLTPGQLTKWVNDTEGLSIAHLRELMICVFCLDGDYEETVKRLKDMNRVLNSEKDENRQIGLNIVR